MIKIMFVCHGRSLYFYEIIYFFINFREQRVVLLPFCTLKRKFLLQ